MSRLQPDQVIDDDEAESCPLCIEELDLSDRNFFPCPCGYQICQFCYNNIKTTMNGLCPACRRRYDDANIVFKKPTEEQLASHKETVANQQKKKAVARQKEAAKREADTLNRKHLAGIRVRQKNLVYITGMKPQTTAENLSEVLRRDEYFGQYGKIVKVVVSKAKDSTNPNAPVGVYVTFESQDAAARCIQFVDGAPNYDTRLRAQYGTTKYCSAYLRGETCMNKGCMFLHEPGDENESFSRQDLSSMNVASTQTTNQTGGIQQGPPTQSQPSAQAPQAIAVASHASDERRSSRDDGRSPSVTSEAPALPTSASWGNRHAPSRRASQHQSVNAPSPLAATGTPVTQPGDSVPEGAVQDEAEAPTQQSTATAAQAPRPQATRPKRQPSLMSMYLKNITSEDFAFFFDEEALGPDERLSYHSMPSWIDPAGGSRRRLGRRELAEQTVRENDSQVASQALSAIAAADADDGAVAGSLQLGGEPDDRSLEARQRGNAIQPPSLDTVTSPIFGMEQTFSPSTAATNSANSDRQRQLLLQQLKSGSPHSQGGQGSSHGRQASRFSFANDTSATSSVNPVANPKLMNQQKNMMPSSHYQQPQSSTSQYFPSGVQGPPPGLKTTGTPPVSGGGMFGQGHGFATAGLRYGVNAGSRSNEDEMMRELMRSRGGSAGSGQPSSEAGRRGVVDLADPNIMQARMHQANAASNQGLYNAQGQGQGGYNSIYGNNFGIGGRA